MQDTISVYIKLSKLTVELVEQQAHQKRISRVAWLREAILKQLQEAQRQADIEAMEHRLLTQLDTLQERIINKVNVHITAEINTLVSNS